MIHCNWLTPMTQWSILKKSPIPSVKLYFQRVFLANMSCKSSKVTSASTLSSNYNS